MVMNAPIPPGTWDCHMHFYSISDVSMSSPVGGFSLPQATVESYNQACQEASIDRFVAVQSVAYGFDNNVMFDALRAYGDDARAIVVAPADIDEATIRRFHRLGARGARAFMLEGALLDWAEVKELCRKIEPFGWHIQIQVWGEQLPELLPLLMSFPCPIVIEHNGRYRSPPSTESEAFTTLLKLLDTDRVWVKLSGPYEMSIDGSPDYRDVCPVARATVKHRPDRLVWASNYPHPGVASPPSERALLDLLFEWTDHDVRLRDRILVDNPSRLYA